VDQLSNVAELSGGYVERVNPVDLTSSSANIIGKAILASMVTIKIKLHKGLHFRNEDEDLMSQNETFLTRTLGNITEETNFTFEYGLKPISELLEMEDLDLTEIKSFPF